MLNKNIVLPTVVGVSAGLAKLATTTAGFNAVGVVGKGIGFGFKATPIAMLLAGGAILAAYGLYKSVK